MISAVSLVWARAMQRTRYMPSCGNVNRATYFGSSSASNKLEISVPT